MTSGSFLYRLINHKTVGSDGAIALNLLLLSCQYRTLVSTDVSQKWGCANSSTSTKTITKNKGCHVFVYWANSMCFCRKCRKFLVPLRWIIYSTTENTTKQPLCVSIIYIVWQLLFFYFGSTICGDPVQNNNFAIGINLSQEHFNRFYSCSILW